MISRIKLFFRLWVAAIFGVIAVTPYALTFVDQKGLFAPLSVIASIKIFQGILLYAVVAAAGVWFSREVGFKTLFFGQENYSFDHWVCLIWRSVICGICVGMTVLSINFLFPRFGPLINETTYIDIFQSFMASFYGAINEELFLRFFVLSFFVWALTKLFGEKNRELWVSCSILCAALIFGMLHLPAAAKVTALTMGIVIRIILLNSIAGVMFGLLFTQCGIEAAMIAHFTADIVLHVLPATALMTFL